MVPWLNCAPWLMAGSSGRKRLIFFLSGVWPKPDVDNLSLSSPSQGLTQPSCGLCEAGTYYHSHFTDENTEPREGNLFALVTQ